MKRSFLLFILMTIILCSCTISEHDNPATLDEETDLLTSSNQYALEIDLQMENTTILWDTTVMDRFADAPILELGFIRGLADFRWVMSIKNNDTTDIQDIEIGYTIKMFKHDVEFGIDRADVINYELVQFKEISCTSYIENLAMDDVNSEVLFYMGTFPYIEITIDSLKINAIEQDVELPHSEYLFHEFNALEDMQHLRKLLGVQ